MVTSSKRFKVGPFTVDYSWNPYGERGNKYNKPGWALKVYFGKGGGYRAYDLPGHSNNVADGWRTRLYVPGVTFTVATNQREILSRRVRDRWWRAIFCGPKVVYTASGSI